VIDREGELMGDGSRRRLLPLLLGDPSMKGQKARVAPNRPVGSLNEGPAKIGVSLAGERPKDPVTSALSDRGDESTIGRELSFRGKAVDVSGLPEKEIGRELRHAGKGPKGLPPGVFSQVLSDLPGDLFNKGFEPIEEPEVPSKGLLG
jgi:hypothetical protein